ncbi:hypothetical protein IFM89_032004 [Coptis chinensis]|uniref:Uncharacterized protein n=1 Tax=Coptis chinensis TaxID=261450 RepID=A0A835H0C3_9MAGN|nr:hypothetical protein IFM89_032004 [Coptis chinensis]
MATPAALPPTPEQQSQRKKGPPQIPTPKELVSHYESQGMETNEATMKVIEDLQNVLVRVVSSGRGKKDKLMAESCRKLDTAITRLAILELKMDSKPGYGESLAIGVVAGGFVRGIGSVVGAVGDMWNAVRSCTKR